MGAEPKLARQNFIGVEASPPSVPEERILGKEEASFTARVRRSRLPSDQPLRGEVGEGRVCKCSS